MLDSARSNSHVYAMRRTAVSKDLDSMGRPNLTAEVKDPDTLLARSDGCVQFGLGRREGDQLLCSTPLANAVKPLHNNATCRALTRPLAAAPVAIGIDRD